MRQDSTDDDGKEEGGGRPWGIDWRSHSTIAIVAAFILPLLVLVLGSRSFLAVPIVYAILFVEGDILIFLAIRRVRSSSSGSKFPGGREGEGGDESSGARGAFLKTSRVDTLTSYVRWAGFGSEYSRREIAKTLEDIIQQKYPEGVASSSDAVTAARNSAQLGSSSLSERKRLMEALSIVVYPYLGEGAGSANRGTMEGDSRKRTTAKRRQYLSNLETLVSTLERDTELPRGDAN